ncbi:MAG: glycosyltransferase family 4 protein, partial [Actinobacteria bacterium]|nr:glycosyltransferase family 4 protein [Actinomycetota bacterium]
MNAANAGPAPVPRVPKPDPAYFRILFVSGEYPPRVGGVGDHVRQLRRALHELGATTWVVSEAVAVGEPAAGIYRNAPGPPGYDLMATARLATALRANVLHVQYQAGAFAAPGRLSLLPSAARWLGFRGTVAVTFHDLAEPYLFPKAGWLRRWTVDRLRDVADVQIYVDAADRQRVLARRPGDAAKSAVVPVGPTVVPDSLPPRDVIRSNLGLAAGEFVVGYFGFRQASKGLAVLAAALRSEPLLAVGARLALIGAAAPLLTGRRAEPALDPRLLAGVSLVDTGPLEEAAISRWLAACDVVALPYLDGASTRRGTLMVAVAHSVPVVSTIPAPPSELEALGEDVLLVPPGDAAALARALRRVHDDRDLRTRLAASAR